MRHRIALAILTIVVLVASAFAGAARDTDRAADDLRRRVAD